MRSIVLTLSYDIVCLEGNAATGKTSCCASIAESLKGVAVPEYTEMLDADHRHALIKSFEDGPSLNDAHVWGIAEKRRFIMLNGISCHIALMDTSLVSVVAFELARIAFQGSGNLPTIIAKYQNLLNACEIALPQKIVHLAADESVRQTRIAKRGTCHPFLARSDVSRYLDNVRASFFKYYLPRPCWASIDTTRLTLDETKAVVEESIQKLEPASTTSSFQAWLSSLSGKELGT